MFLFIHIPKTAGTTLASILQRNFRQRYQPVYEASQHDFFSETQVLALTSFFPEAICLASHHFAAPLPRAATDAQPLDGFTFVRDPLDRILSLYHYQQQEAQRGMTRHFGHLPFDQYFERTRARDLERTAGKFSHLVNLQAHVSGTHAAGDSLTERLRQDFFFVGVSERFDESLLVLRRKLASRGLSFDVHYRSRKVGGRRDARAELPVAVYDRVLADNHIDCQLHVAANQLLDDEIAAYGPPFAADLEQFHRRQRTWQPRALVAECFARGVGAQDKVIRRVFRRYL